MPWLSEEPLQEAFGSRALLLSSYGGADFGECAQTVRRVAGDGVDAWYREWRATADMLVSDADASAAAGHHVSAREAYLRASTYYRTPTCRCSERRQTSGCGTRSRARLRRSRRPYRCGTRQSSPSAAAFEQRIAALWADPGQWDQRDRLPLADDEKVSFPDGVSNDRFADLEAHLRSAKADPMLRWRLLQRGLWVHGVASLFEYFAELARYELSPVARHITCPTLITAAEDDSIAAGAPLLHRAISAKHKILLRFTQAEGAGGHCESEGRRRFHQRCYDWLDDLLAPLPT